MIDGQPLHIRFDKIDGFIRVDGGTRYSVLFGSENYNFVYNKISYLTEVRSGITYVISHYCAKLKVDLFDYMENMDLTKKSGTL